MKKNNVLLKAQQIAGLILVASLIISIVFVIFKIIVSPPGVEQNAGDKMKSDYVLMLIQCLLGLGAFILPNILRRRWHIALPDFMLLLYFIFLFCAIFLGEVRSFYYNVSNWDTILHISSGAMLGALGFSIVKLLNDTEKVKVNLSPLFIAMFAFCFAVSLGALWEIYEYTFDGILQLNMQKYMLENGTQLIGRAALTDTMKDLIVDAIGAFIISFIGYKSIKKHKDWLDNFEMKKH